MTDEHMTRLIQKYGGPVPRYTSYPTAVQFQGGFTPERAMACMAEVPQGAEVSFYIHIPFCHSLCHYCGCHTKIVHHTGIISAYIETLCREITLAAAYLPKNLVVSRVHFGGGSPNYAPEGDIEKILDTIRTAFDGSEGMKIDMECDPRLLSNTRIEGLARLGVRRVSLGIQDFDETVQKAVNRIQTVEHIRRQVSCLRHNGIDDINFDLIVGLPEQTPDSVKRTVEETMKIRPPRIATFSYAHVPWMKKHQKILEKYRFPTPQERFMMQEDIRDMLCANGYGAIGIDHYALPQDSLAQAKRQGAIRRNFQGYTDDPAMIVLGFGLSSVSSFQAVYTQNTLDASAYRNAVEKGVLPVEKGCVLGPADIAARKAIMQVMCHFHIDMREYEGVPVAAPDLLDALEKDGIITRAHDNMIKITDAGRPFTRVVASCFDTYFHKSDNKEERHAKAV